jgi:hypothetical protein
MRSSHIVLAKVRRLLPWLTAVVPAPSPHTPQVKKQGPLKMLLFNLALRYKQFWMRLGFSTAAASPLCNRLFFSKTQVGHWQQLLYRCWSGNRHAVSCWRHCLQTVSGLLATATSGSNDNFPPQAAPP